PTADAITLTDPIPAGMTFVALVPDPGFLCTTPTVGASAPPISCTSPIVVGPALASGASAVFTLILHIDSTTPPGTTFINIATIAAPGDRNDENDSGLAATTTPPPPIADMVVTKTG